MSQRSEWAPNGRAKQRQIDAVKLTLPAGLLLLRLSPGLAALAPVPLLGGLLPPRPGGERDTRRRGGLRP